MRAHARAALVTGLFAIAAPGARAAPAHSWRGAPDAAHARTNPYEGQPDAVRAGRKLFARHCATCHDQGRGGAAPRLDGELVRSATAGDLFWFLTNGNLPRGMPSWSRLPEARRWQLVAFLKSLETAPPATAGRTDARDGGRPRRP